MDTLTYEEFKEKQEARKAELEATGVLTDDVIKVILSNEAKAMSATIIKALTDKLDEVGRDILIPLMQLGHQTKREIKDGDKSYVLSFRSTVGAISSGASENSRAVTINNITYKNLKDAWRTIKGTDVAPSTADCLKEFSKPEYVRS